MTSEELADLLDGFHEEERAARSALIDELLARGCAPEEIRQAAADDRLALMPLELVLREEGSR